MATNQVASLGIKVSAHGVEKAKAGIKGIGSVAKRVKNQIFSLNGAMGALGAGAVMKSVIQSASGLESLRVRLKFLTGSTQDAGRAFDTMTGFASKVPFALEDIQKASPLLLTVTDDIEDLNGLLEMTGDIAAVSGLDFVKTAEQLQRSMASGIASADLFRERGVSAFLGFEAGVTYSAEQTKARLKEMWEDGTTTAKGATKDLAKTFQGQVSMMEDAWFKLKIQFADSGVFDVAKDVVLKITETMGKPSTISSIKEFGKGVVAVAEGLGSVALSIAKFPAWMLEAGVILSILGGKKVKLAVASIVGIGVVVDKLGDALRSLHGAGAGSVSSSLGDVGERIPEVKAMRNEIKKLQDILSEVKKTGKFNGKILDDVTQENVITGINSSINSFLTKIDEAKQKQREFYAEFDKSKVSNEDRLMNWKFTMAEKSFEDMDTANALYDKLFTKVTAYKESIKDIGIELTPAQKLMQGYGESLEKIHNAVKKNADLAPFQAGAIQEVSDAYLEAVNRMEGLEIDKKVEALTESMTTSITDMIMTIGQGSKDLKESVLDMARVVLAEFVKIKVAQPMAQALAGGFGGFDFSSIFSADGGGFTGQGSRSGGVDGRGGFPAILHPNETVIDHNINNKSEGANNVSVSFNITANDTKGFDELIDSRRGMIVGIINQAMNDRGMIGVT